MGDVGMGSVNVPSPSGTCTMGLGSGDTTSRMRLAPRKVVGTVGAASPVRGTPIAGITSAIGGHVSPHDFVARRVLVTNSATGVTRLITGRVCGVQRDGGDLAHKRTSCVPGSKTTLGLVLSGLSRRRRTVVRVFTNAASHVRGSFAVHVGPRTSVGRGMTFHFSGGLKVLSTSGLSNRPCCVSVVGRRALPPVSPGNGRGGGASNIVCGVPKGTRIAMFAPGGHCFSKRLPIARFKAARYLVSGLFGGGMGAQIVFGPGAKKVIGVSGSWGSVSPLRDGVEMSVVR